MECMFSESESYKEESIDEREREMRENLYIYVCMYVIYIPVL